MYGVESWPVYTRRLALIRTFWWFELHMFRGIYRQTRCIQSPPRWHVTVQLGTGIYERWYLNVFSKCVCKVIHIFIQSYDTTFSCCVCEWFGGLVHSFAYVVRLLLAELQTAQLLIHYLYRCSCWCILGAGHLKTPSCCHLVNTTFENRFASVQCADSSVGNAGTGGSAVLANAVTADVSEHVHYTL
jgi:hypothetical protein